MDTVVDVLIAAGMKIAKPAAWTQGALARRASGAELSNPTAASAKCWDVLGAIHAVTGVNPIKPTVSLDRQRLCVQACAALSATASRLHRKTAEAVNDAATHDHALELV